MCSQPWGYVRVTLFKSLGVDTDGADPEVSSELSAKLQIRKTSVGQASKFSNQCVIKYL